MSQVIKIMRGLPGSGKTTIAKEWVRKNRETRARVNRDDIRMMLYGNKTFLSPTEENLVTKTELSLIETAVKNKKSVVIDNVNLKAKNVHPYLQLAADYNVPVTWEDVKTPLETILQRNSQRGVDKVPDEAIHKLWKKYFTQGKFPPFPVVTPHTVYVPDTTLPKAVLVDVDGTIMIMSPSRGPFDWEKVLEDTPNLPVVETVKALHQAGYLIVAVSGRENTGSVEEDTLLSLTVAGVPVDELFLRKENDWRKDSIIKEEIFYTHIAPKYNVVFALDDRQQVVDMYRRKIGIPVFQVNYGDF